MEHHMGVVGLESLAIQFSSTVRLIFHLKGALQYFSK